ncbi:hypothetical protein RB195_025443 [Necator americanus]|uniref:Uncharacterized protein n=1 Tax=Necator americanus TaxID=51031 RepID=A0ABR1EUH5_NECAM
MRLNDNRLTRAVSDWVPTILSTLQEEHRPPMRKEEPLGESGTRWGQMEELLAPARPVRRSTGVKDVTQFCEDVHKDVRTDVPPVPKGNKSNCYAVME